MKYLNLLMATIYENLEQLISTKKSIKQILEVYSTDTINDQFSTYADNIRNLYTSKTCLNSLFEGSTESTFNISVSFPWTNVVGTAQMFKDCVNLTTLDISTWDMSNVLTVYGMFNGAGITELDLSSLDWRSVSDAGRAFQSMPNCTTIKLPKNLAPIMANQLFWNSAKLTTIEGLDTIDMSKCKSIKSIFCKTNYTDMTDITNWNTSNVENMAFVFSYNTATSVDLSNWDTSKVKDMQVMFYKSSITDYSSIYNWNTSKVENVYDLFGTNTAVTSLDLSNWDFSSCTNMSYAFYNNFNLTSLKLPQNINKVTTLQGTFNCAPLESLDVSNIDTSNCTNLGSTFNAYYQNPNTNKVTYYRIGALTGYENWNTSNVTSFEGTFQCQDKLTSLDLSNWSFKNATDLRWMFTYCSGLQELKLRDVTNKSTSLHCMFYKCSSLTELNVSNLCTSNCTSLGYTFEGCYNLQDLSTVENWDTSNVTNLAYTFAACNALTSLDLSKWNTSNVTNMCRLFSYDSSVKDNYMGLKEIKGLENWDTSKVKDMRLMFNGCQCSTYNIANWDTSKVTSMRAMFQLNPKLADASFVENWDVSNVTDTSWMFNTCDILPSLDLSKWDMRKNKCITFMFNRTYGLKSLNVSNWDLQSCTEATRFAQLTSSLKRLDLSTWKNTGNITNYSYFLYNFDASVIEYLDISSLDTTSVVAKTSYDNRSGLQDFVTNCIHLDTIIFGEAFGKCKVAITLDLTTVGAHWDIKDGAEGSEIKYQLNSKTYESMLTMYDRATAGLPAMTIKFSTRHNIPEGWIDKMTARGYTIAIV